MITSPDARGQIDGSVAKHILAYLPDLPITIVPISWFPDFVFKSFTSERWILIDFMEPHAEHAEYDKFLAWIKELPPILTFRREVNKDAISPVLKPIEFACHLPIPPLSNRQDFDSRPLDVLNVWGYSHQDRPKLHGDIFGQGMTKYGLNVIDSWDKWNNDKKCWLTVYAPYWKRIPMPELLNLMQKTKITVSLPGNGRKAFRHAECVGTLMALQRDSLAWSYPWTDENSIGLTPEMDFFSLLKATERTDLYDIYCACDENMRLYEAKTYAKDYILKTIESVL